MKYIKLSAAVLILAGCMNPITEDLSRIMNDKTPPVISLSEPLNLSYYSSVILLKGTIYDTGGAVSEASYSFSGSDVSGVIPLGENGTFEVEIASRTPEGIQVIDGPQMIEITARDLGGNVAAEQVQIIRESSGTDITDFNCNAGSREASFTWSPVPGAVSYELYNGETAEVRTNVSSPYVWSDLINGDLYTFQLKANIPTELGDDAWSGLLSALPLGPLTLSPSFTNSGMYRISLSWRAIGADIPYVVERRIKGGSWSIRTITEDNSFVDDQCLEENWYEYRIYPQGHSNIKSSPVSVYPFNRSVSSAEHISWYNSTGEVKGVLPEGDLVYLADGSGDLKILDISDAKNPGLLSSLSLNGRSYVIEKKDNYLYILPDTREVHIVDVSDPAHPVRVSSAPISNIPRTMTLYGNYIYVVTHYGDRLEIINISNPLAPIHVSTSSVALLARPYSITADGSYVYISAENGNLEIWDVRNPTTPVRISSVGIGGKSSGMTKTGQYLYAAVDNNQGIKIINVSNPASPVVAASYKYGTDAEEDPVDIAIEGSKGYVADINRGVIILNLDNPLAPSEVGRISQSGGSSLIALDDTVYLAAGYNGMELISAGNLDQISHITDVDANGYDSRGVLLADNLLYLLDYNGINIYGVDSPWNPVISSRYISAYSSYGQSDNIPIPADLEGGYLFASFDRKNIEILERSESGSLERIGTYHVSDSNNIRDIKAEGPILSVILQSEGLLVLDIQDPANSFPLGGSGIPYDQTQGVASDGNYIYATHWNGFYGIDISDTSNIFPSWNNDIGVGKDIVVSGDKAFVSLDEDLSVIDINPQSATWKSQLDRIGLNLDREDRDHPQVADRIYVMQDLVFIAAQYGGLHIINGSNPNDLVLWQVLPPRNSTFGAAVMGDYVYVVDGHTDWMTQGNSGIRIYKME